MFIEFNKIMVNINYIIIIYKTTYTTTNLRDNETFFTINLTYNHIQNVYDIREIYNTAIERDERFKEIIKEINNK